MPSDGGKPETLTALALTLDDGRILTGWTNDYRIPTDRVPAGWHRYGVRWADFPDDYECPYADVEPFVWADHAFDFITRTELSFDDDAYYQVTDREDVNRIAYLHDDGRLEIADQRPMGGGGPDPVTYSERIEPLLDVWRTAVTSDDSMPDGDWSRAVAEWMGRSVNFRDAFMMIATAPYTFTSELQYALAGPPADPDTPGRVDGVLRDAFHETKPPSFHRLDRATDILMNVAHTDGVRGSTLEAQPLAVAAYIKWWEGDATPASRLCARAQNAADGELGLMTTIERALTLGIYPDHVKAHPTALARYRVDEWMNGRAGRPEGRWAIHYRSDRDDRIPTRAELEYFCEPAGLEYPVTVNGVTVRDPADDTAHLPILQIRHCLRDADDRLLEAAGLNATDIDHWQMPDGQWSGPKYGRQVLWRDDLPTPDAERPSTPEPQADTTRTRTR